MVSTRSRCTRSPSGWFRSGWSARASTTSPTDWGAFQHNLSQIPAIWNGGLSIFGAVAGGMLGCWIGCRFAKIPFWQVADCVAPGVILAQALGRWGNYFNQELYGRPSKWPWSLKIDNPPLPYHPGETFQPTFLYESLLDVGVFVVLMWFVRRYWSRVPWGTIFALYVVLYDGVRVFIEKLRSDPANIYLGPTCQRVGLGRAVRGRADRVHHPVPQTHGLRGATDAGNAATDCRAHAHGAADGRHRGAPQVAEAEET